MPLFGHRRWSRRALLLSWFVAVAAMLAPAPVAAHEGEAHAEGATASAAAASASDGLADEPVIPGIDWATDFQIAPSGDVYAAGHDGEIRRYRRVGGTVAHPRYELQGELIWQFQVTKQTDRGLIGIALDSSFESGQRYLYALLTRGSRAYVGDVPGGSANRIRRTSQLVRIQVPANRAVQASDLTVILGADAPPGLDSACKPYTAGQAAAMGETDAFPNGVGFYDGSAAQGSDLAPNLNENHIFPDGDLATRADGDYDCIPSDGDTHGPGTVISAPDGSLFLTIGDAALWNPPQASALRSMNLESYVGKVLHIDRNGRGVAGHPFCPGESDLTRVCTKVWAMGLRNAFRVGLLPPDSATGGQPALAVGDVGNFSVERLTIAHPGDNLGWPCWEGSYFNFPFSGPTSGFALKTGWGGPALRPAAPGKTSCERKTATGSGTGLPAKSADITWPTIEYQHEQDPIRNEAEREASSDNNGSAIVAGGMIENKPGADASVALPADWAGSLVFGDYVRGWIYRVRKDPSDPNNTQRDGGLRVPADEGRAVPTVQTDYAEGRVPDPLLERIAEPPPTFAEPPPSTRRNPAYYRLTSRQGPDGALWYMRYGGASQSGGLYRLRTAPVVDAEIESVSGACAAGGETQGPITLTARDAGTGASYAWDTDGDGVADPGRTGRTTVISAAQAASTTGAKWVRIWVASGTSRSVATRYVCAGKTPQVTISAPADGTQVVLGEPTVVSAVRPAGDAAETGIPDSDLKWKAVTLHGGNHEHDLVERTPPFETVGGQQRMQITVTPDPTHELGSFTQVRIFAPQADGNTVGKSIRLEPKPVGVTLASSPAGARLSMVRDGPSTVVEAAPGTFQVPAGYVTSISAAVSWTDSAGTQWNFKRWSDGALNATRGWRVPAAGGAAPVAEYADATTHPTTPESTTPEQTTPTTPVVTTPTTTPTPPTPNDPDPTSPVPTPPAGPSVTPPRVELPPPPPPVLLPPTSLELATAPLSVALVRGPGRSVTGVKVALELGRLVDSGGLVVKVAVRDASCRWWVFGRKRFAGRAATGARGATRRICVEAPSWKRVPATWSADGATASVSLGKALASGRYALRVRVQRGSAKLAERVRAVRVP